MSIVLEVAPERGVIDQAVVLLSERSLHDFLSAAKKEYAAITADEPRPCFAVLIGRSAGSSYVVEEVAFGRNARCTTPAATEEFSAAIVPRFGSAYENPVRAWWLDPVDLLRISRYADRMGAEILGSIHLHPDWHRLGPESERCRPLSERPTPMDEYVFGNSGWPVNVVCYLERRHGAFYYTLAAWNADCGQLPLRVSAPVPEARR